MPMLNNGIALQLMISSNNKKYIQNGMYFAKIDANDTGLFQQIMSFEIIEN